MPQPVCAIIGAGDGLGRALAAKFASQEFDIALISRSEAGSAAAIEAATGITANVRFFSADATQPDTIDTALARVADEMDEIDVLIYNARGEFTACEPLDMTYAALEDTYRVEVVGAFAAAHSSNGFLSYDGVQFLSGKDQLKSYKAPDARYFTQVFCEVCSSLMPRRDAERGITVIPMGSLGDDPEIKPVRHIFVDYKAEWHDITDNLPQFPEGPPS